MTRMSRSRKRAHDDDRSTIASISTREYRLFVGSSKASFTDAGAAATVDPYSTLCTLHQKLWGRHSMQQMKESACHYLMEGEVLFEAWIS